MKFEWYGEITSVQPRFRLLRPFDQRHHTYLGYAIRVKGCIAGSHGEACFGVGKAAHQKHPFEVGQVARGQAHPMADVRMEPVDYYKVSRLYIEPRREPVDAPPPWHGPAPSIETYHSSA